MEPRTRASLLWGAVGALSFLVLVQGYELVATLPVGVVPRLAVALLVAIAATVLTYVVAGRRDDAKGRV